MNKKNRTLITSVASLMMLIPAMASCNGNKNQAVHEHAFYPVAAKEATCVSTGNIAYDQCIYCKKIEVNGEEKTAEEVLLPMDPTAHKHLKEFEAISPTCISGGNTAYSYCEDCGKYVVDGKTVDSNESAILPIEPNGHHFEELAYKAPTCGTEGYKAHMECTLCHKSFIDGEEVSKDSILIPATKEHVYDENGADNVCKKAFKLDEQVFDENNAYSISPCSKGKQMDATQEKAPIAEALISERMTFITQTDGETSTTVSNENGDISLTHKVDKNNPQAFTRIAPGIRKSDGTIESYVGKFLFSMDVTFKDDVYVARVGAMITNNAFSVIFANNQAKLLGRTGTNSEAKADRSFEAGVTYRFVYSMETTDETQLIQLWGCSNMTTITYSNFHLIPLTGAEGNVRSSFLYFGKTDMANNEFHVDPTPDPEPDPEPTPTKKNVLMPNEQNFFDATSWTKATSNDKEKVGEGIYETDGSLSFDKNSAARINLFHVKANDETLIHVGDNGSKKADQLASIYSKEYSYSLEMLVNGTFDMGILAAGNALDKSVTGQAAFYLSFKEDGSISMSQTSGNVPSVFIDHFNTPAGSYEQSKKFTFTIKLHRTDAETLKAQFLINGTPLKFSGDTITTETGYSYGFDENGVFTSSKYLASIGMGQRLSILPTGDASKVTISDLKIETKTVETPVEPEASLDALEVSNPYTMYNGNDLFASSNWTAADANKAVRNDETIKDSDGNLVFTKDTSSRIDFFHVAKDAKGNLRHLGDKKANIAGLDIKNKDYRFDLDMSSSGAFDLMMLGNATAFNKSDKSNSFYLSADNEGALSLSFALNKTFMATFVSKTKFDFTKKQRVSIIMNRVNDSDIDIVIFLDYKQVQFEGEASKPNTSSALSVNEDGKVSLTGLLATVGLGQRLGVMPGDSSTVKISGAVFLPTPVTE